MAHFTFFSLGTQQMSEMGMVFFWGGGSRCPEADARGEANVPLSTADFTTLERMATLIRRDRSA